ncbi:MAG TPA: MAPEG family protein [Steroidobacteraceae bacterium]|nr:MAPEG family protein [Steroidobacteraceae bacterium]
MQGTLRTAAMTDPIWLPCAAMAGLTALVWLKLYADRLGEMRARRIDPQALATARTAAGKLEETGAADNFRNLFEVPVLFYLLCVALALNGGSAPGFVATAWVYVALRAVHSLVHVTYNRVVHRFLVYVASTLLLFGMWAAFVARILS